MVHSLDDLWHRKYAETEGGRVVPVAAGGSGEEAARPLGVEHDEGHGQGHAIHMPSPSYFPIVAAAGLPVLGYGLVFSVLPAIVIGAVVTLAGFFGWALESSAE